MRAASLIVVLVLLSLGLSVGTGCKKQAAASSDSTQSYQQLPEATNVLAALSQKNYDDAIAAFVKLKGSVATEQQQNEYGLLTREVKDKLLEASASDPKAQEAMQAFRLVVTGR